ncbi:glycosyltransferase family 4 protein [Niveibacterium sp.]|uniref:glycosyltransferase family 4 protein n=1 Tax=Niveibacterium sp. TaxID=2017444 RepID=UPI0035B3CC2A
MRIVLFANTEWYLYNFRRALALALKSAGHEVILLSPDGEWGARLRELGLDWRPFPLSRRGMNPFAELLTVRRLARLYGQLQPDLVHHFTIKCVIYGSLASHVARVPHIVNSITGLGHMMLSRSLVARMLRPFILGLYRLSLRGTDVIFQNRDNAELFERYGLLAQARRHLVPGSGLDFSRFDSAPPRRDQPPVILMVGRLLWAKGVSDYVDAARIVRQRFPEVEFWLAGEADTHTPDCIPEAQIAIWRREGHVKFLGHRNDIAALNARCSIAVLASRDGEGLPRSLLEAAASARAIVATNVPGSRDVFVNGMGGLLVPPSNPAALADAVAGLLADPVRLEEMGQAARVYSAERFSDARIIATTLSIYGIADDDGAPSPVSV